MHHNATPVEEATYGKELTYTSGLKDLCAVFFYTLIAVVVHAVIQEYILDVSINCLQKLLENCCLISLILAESQDKASPVQSQAEQVQWIRPAPHLLCDFSPLGRWCDPPWGTILQCVYLVEGLPKCHHAIHVQVLLHCPTSLLAALIPWAVLPEDQARGHAGQSDLRHHLSPHDRCCVRDGLHAPRSLPLGLALRLRIALPCCSTPPFCRQNLYRR